MKSDLKELIISLKPKLEPEVKKVDPEPEPEVKKKTLEKKPKVVKKKKIVIVKDLVSKIPLTEEELQELKKKRDTPIIDPEVPKEVLIEPVMELVACSEAKINLYDGIDSDVQNEFKIGEPLDYKIDDSELEIKFEFPDKIFDFIRRCFSNNNDELYYKEILCNLALLIHDEIDIRQYNNSSIKYFSEVYKIYEDLESMIDNYELNNNIEICKFHEELSELLRGCVSNLVNEKKPILQIDYIPEPEPKATPKSKPKVTPKVAPKATPEKKPEINDLINDELSPYILGLKSCIHTPINTFFERHIEYAEYFNITQWGYENFMADLIIKELNKLEYDKRPMHF
jgi:hypothetical protein